MSEKKTINGYENLSYQEKSDLWGQWSSKGNSFPYEIDDLVQEINMQKNLDIYESYGFKVAYYMFMENEGLEVIEDYFKIDDSYRIYGT